MRYCTDCNQTFVADDWKCPKCGSDPQRIDGFACFAPELARDNADYDPDYFHLLVSIEDGSFWFEARNRLIHWALTRFFPDAASLLEVGVGTGFVTRALRRALPNSQVWGSDIHVEGLHFARKRLDSTVDLFQMDARRIPFRSEFDVVCMFDVLEHIEDDDLVLREAGRALRPHGGMLLTVPQHMFLWGPADVAAFHKRRYGIHELARKMRDAGFEVLFKTSFVSILLPLLYASRLRSRRSGKYDIRSEQVISPVVNRLLRSLLSVESALIHLGIRLPFGGSQLLIARKLA